jgi:sodium-coupled neutral amino acid transporter 9
MTDNTNRRGPILFPPNSPQYQRMKYYSAIRTGLKHMSQSTTYLDVPTHMIDDNAFIIFQTKESADKKHSSLATIFSVWNTMVGSSLLTVPWAFSNSGIVLGIFISFVTFVIAYYTCSLYIRLGKNDSDFADTVYKYYGKKGWIVTMIFSNLLMFAVVIIYYELMSQALYPVIAAVLEWVFNTEDNLDTGLAFDRFSLFYTCIALSVILYPVVSKKDISLFVTVNSFGVIFVCITITFIFSYGFYSFSNTNFIISNDDNDVTSDSDDRNVSLFRSQFSSLAGMMTLGYFLHNISLSIVKENRNPEHNQRDVFIGYFLVF